MAAQTIAISETLLAEMRDAAQAEERSLEEVLQDAIHKYLDARSWNKWLEGNQQHAKSLGFQETDVDRLIEEYRAEKRGR